MTELISLLTEKTGISNEQAVKVLETVKDFVKEKFPMMAGAVDNLLGTEIAPAAGTTHAASEEGFLDMAKDKLGGLFGAAGE